MTDNDIIKALECCASGDDGCENGCPLQGKCISPIKESERIMQNALDLISRLQAKVIKEQNKNSKLRNERNRLQAENERLTHITRNLIGEIKAEAYTEFAERLKTEYAKGMNWFKKKESYYVDVGDIDNLLKEMVGENK